MKLAHARPKTTRSSKELAPSLLAPWTEAHADSPAAQRPGTISSLPSFFVSACNEEIRHEHERPRFGGKRDSLINLLLLSLSCLLLAACLNVSSPLRLVKILRGFHYKHERLCQTTLFPNTERRVDRRDAARSIFDEMVQFDTYMYLLDRNLN